MYCLGYKLPWGHISLFELQTLTRLEAPSALEQHRASQVSEHTRCYPESSSAWRADCLISLSANLLLLQE